MTQPKRTEALPTLPALVQPSVPAFRRTVSAYFTDDWLGCYDDTWHGGIAKESFGHPAKFSRLLIRRIYKHAIENEWLKEGDIVVDPFGGVALGAVDAMIYGCNWVGCELEPQWAKLGNENILNWQKWYTGIPLGKAVLINGDSRDLMKLVTMPAASLIVSSPPYINSLKGQKDGIDWEKAKQNGKDGGGHGKGASCNATVGASPGQLAAMPEGRFDLAVSSPPYETIATGAGGLNTKPAKKAGQQSGRKASAASQDTNQRYGRTAGQLAMSGESFWTASRQIIEQVHALLRPHGHAIWVTKNFVRKHKEVDFNERWRTLCESVGFKTVCVHRAMQVEKFGAQLTLDGGEHVLQKQKKSFFRRNAEKKGSPPIDYEQVTCMRKAT